MPYNGHGTKGPRRRFYDVRRQLLNVANPDEPRVWKQRSEPPRGYARTPGYFRPPETSEVVDNNNPACDEQQRTQNAPEDPEHAPCRTTQEAPHNEDGRPASTSPRSPERPNGGASSPRSEVGNDDNGGSSSRSRTAPVGGEPDPECWEDDYDQDESEARHREGMNTSPGHYRKEPRLCASANGKSSSLISVMVLNCPFRCIVGKPLGRYEPT